MSWRVETLNDVVDRELEALPADMLAYLQRIVGLIETFDWSRYMNPGSSTSMAHCGRCG